MNGAKIGPQLALLGLLAILAGCAARHRDVIQIR